mmetsp:Transcript_73132/g.152665  ORF Transcript_73132/g.152665 Transcript_73132/m.152665 type:complete len:319 (-) Transcript_73132:5-961(-)
MSFSVFVKRRRQQHQHQNSTSAACAGGPAAAQAVSLMALQQEWKGMSDEEKAAACSELSGKSGLPSGQEPQQPQEKQQQQQQQHQQQQQQQQQQQREKQGKDKASLTTTSANKRTGAQAFLYQQQRQQLMNGNLHLARPCSLQTELEAAKRRKMNAENGRKACSGSAVSSVQLPAPKFPGLNRRFPKGPGGTATAAESPFEAHRKRQELTKMFKEQAASRSAGIASSATIDLEAAQASVTGPRLSFDWSYDDPIEDDEGDEAFGEGDADDGPELTVTLDKDVEGAAARSLLRQELSRGISAQQLSNLIVSRGAKKVKA